MGTSERKQRERQQRETLFLDKASELIAREGLLNLQMARLAEACDYATGTLYQHFSSKEDLLVALVTRGAEAHAELFRRVRDWDATPRDRMFAIAVTDTDFAKRYHHHARLTKYVFTEAVWENASQERREQVLECAQPVAEIVGDIVQQALDQGDLEPRGLNAMELALGTWCLCEGMQMLVHTQGLLEAMRIRTTRMLLYRHIATHLNGMNWRPLMNLEDDREIEALVARAERDLLSRDHEHQGANAGFTGQPS